MAQAIEESQRPDSPYLQPPGSGAAGASSALGFFVPPPFAIAHSLLSAWAARGAPWFAAGEQPAQPAQQLQAASNL